ncbi:MAG: hypothetical protein WKF67_05570 [Rubrobacteraceae bacterium]
MDSKGQPITNPWFIEEWFYLTEKHDRLLVTASREHGKTSIMAVALPLIEMKLNRNIRILIISDVHQKSTERTRLLREHIETNRDYLRFAPAVEIERKTGDYEFTVKRDLILKEPTVRSTYAGGPISGSRWDLIILDDLATFQVNSFTAEQRNKLRRWYADEVLNSVARGGKIWVIGTTQHHNDLYEDIKRDPAFHTVSYPALDEDGLFGYAEKNAHIKGKDAVCLWPEMHDFAELDAKREANPDSFMRQQMLIAIPETGLVFRRLLMDAALERGKSVSFEPKAAQVVALDPGWGRASMLAIQERAGDRIDLWAEHSFTHIGPDEVAEVVAEHCVNHNVLVAFYDAADPGQGNLLGKALAKRGCTTRPQRVPFGEMKKLSIATTRWLLQSGRVAWGSQTTTVHTPGHVRVVPSIFREEVLDYALKEGEDYVTMKGSDHGPDAWTAYASRWIAAWAKANNEAA